MSPEEYKEFLLANIPTAALVSGGTHIACRCFYCPDGHSSNSKHFYISIPQNANEPSMYYCHKCHASGIVTSKTLMDWGIYNPQVGTDITNHNKNIKLIGGNAKQKIFRLSNNYTTDSDINAYKLSYINTRLGTNLTYQDLQRLKIVLSLKDILRSNGINYTSRADPIIDQLDINFLGFLSIDNSFLNMRRLCDEGKVYKSIDKRYINYKIFPDSQERFYTVPTQIDLNIASTVKIHIAEGPFDILSIYLNLRKGEPGIYSSIAGSNYLKTALYFIENYKLPDVELHFYPDNDETGNKSIKNIEQYFAPIGIPVYIHRNIYQENNTGYGVKYEKDFGVALNRIHESIERKC